MAIAEMKKVMIASHRSEVGAFLEALQQKGIVQVLDAERAMVSKEWPDLQVEGQRPRDVQEMVSRLETAIDFLNDHAVGKSETSIFKPLVEVDPGSYSDIVSGKEALALLDETEALNDKIDGLLTDKENTIGLLGMLGPWKDMDLAVEEISDSEKTSCIAGLLPDKNFDEVVEKLGEVSAGVEVVGMTGAMRVCVVACMKEDKGVAQKILRSGDFEVVSFDGMEGTVSELLEKHKQGLCDIESSIVSCNEKAAELSRKKLSLQILFDHFQNLLGREETRVSVPGTESTVLLEGWVKKRHFGQLEKVVGGFGASSVTEMEIAEGEEPPVDIDNPSAVRPFETITRLYGMPSPVDVDPTVFLAPFFALFFGLCLTDAGYGIIMVAGLWWAIRKMQGNKGALWMVLTCSVMAIIAGALTGGWFGDAVQTLVPAKYAWVNGFREKIMLFDPITNPMPFFKLSLALGYAQIMFGLVIAFFNNLRRKEYAAAVCEQLAWLIFLNSIVLYGVTKKTSPGVSAFFGIVALSQVFVIFFFTERKSGIAGRIGGGTFALFSTVFYLGDVLSYVRLMALGMVTAGLGIAVNILVKLVMEVPYVGWVLGALLFVGGHLFNMAMSTLSSFVHSLRLQFVEFFPKFLAGGGHDFRPMKEEYKHVTIKKAEGRSG